MSAPLAKKVTLADLKNAAESGQRLAMLTCYDYTQARLMQQAGVPLLLVGDSAANVVLGYPTTLPVSLDFMIEITAAVRRGAPLCFLMADMPFGSYQASVTQGVKNVTRMVQLSGCDCVKLEVADGHLKLVKTLAGAGVAIVAHLGLRPQSVAQTGYRYQGRTADEAHAIVRSSRQMARAGAVAILLEAVPPEVTQAVVDATQLPVIGCGAGSPAHASVFVTQDALGFTDRPPRFAPRLADLATPTRDTYAEYVKQVSAGQYPASVHDYAMDEVERQKFLGLAGRRPAEPMTP